MNKEQKQMAKVIKYLEGIEEMEIERIRAIIGEHIEQEWIDGGISKKTLYRLRWLNEKWGQKE